MKLYKIEKGQFMVYDDKLEAWYSGYLNKDFTLDFPGRIRAQNQIDRFSVDFDKDLKTILGRNTNLKKIFRVWKKKTKLLTGKLKAFEEERFPQFSPRSKYLQEVGWQRYLLEGIDQDISQEAQDLIPRAISMVKDIIVSQLPKDFTFKIPTFDELESAINQQATTGLPFWQSKKLTKKDGTSTDFAKRLADLFIKFGNGIDLPTYSYVTPGSRSQAKEPNVPGIRAIFIPDERTTIVSELLELIISPLKQLIYQLAYRSPESEYAEYIEMKDYAKRKRARIASIDLSRWDTTVSHIMIESAYQLLQELIDYFTPDVERDRITKILNSAKDTMLDALMFVEFNSEYYTWFKKLRGVISGHGNTSSVGSLVHWLTDAVLELMYFDKHEESLLSLEKTQYMADDARTVVYKPLHILTELYRKHFNMFLRPDSMVDRTVVEFKQRLYLPDQKIGIVSITRLLNSLFRLERVIRGKPTKVDWAVRNLQIGNDAAGHPLRKWFWQYIKQHDKYIKLGIGKSSSVFERFHKLPENQEFVTWLLEH